jgi:hypothetical protein
MVKYGFELEMFVTNDKGKLVLAQEAGLPFDEGGLLAEARSEPHREPGKALALFKWEISELEKMAEDKGLFLHRWAFRKVPQKFFDSVIRRYGKGPVPRERGSMYGHEYLGGKPIFRAGLHVHFSDSSTVTLENGFDRIVPHPVDMPRIIRSLDEAFSYEIKKSGRLPGLYEMKFRTHGGFEYRSLPTNVDFVKLERVLRGLHL